MFKPGDRTPTGDTVLAMASVSSSKVFPHTLIWVLLLDDTCNTQTRASEIDSWKVCYWIDGDKAGFADKSYSDKNKAGKEYMQRIGAQLP